MLTDVPMLEVFMHQQLHLQGPSRLISPEPGHPNAAIIEIGVGETIIDLHLHQASLIHAVNFAFLDVTKRPQTVHILAFDPDRNFDAVERVDVAKISGRAVNIPVRNVVTPIVRVKVASEARCRMEVKLQADSAYLSELARRVRVARHLAALSRSNSDRRDNRFDSKYVQNGKLLRELADAPPLPFSLSEQLLYPRVEARTRNLLGEPVVDGDTILVPLMNRNANVEKNLPGWLAAGFDEVLLMDWASDVPVSGLPIVRSDPRVRVIRVDGPKRYIRTWALNLANRCVRRRHVFKCDSDVEVSPKFRAVHTLRPGRFIVGDWRHGRDFNERHLHGDVYYHIDDFELVNGFDERIINYGQEDTNLTDRMILAGLQKMVLSYDTLRHQEHSNVQRGSNQAVVHPIVNTHYYRALCNYRPMWSRHETSVFKPLIELVNPNEVRFRVQDTYKETTDEPALTATINMVAGWYAGSGELKLLSQEEKLALIWDRSKE